METPKTPSAPDSRPRENTRPSAGVTAVKIWISILLLAIAAYGGHFFWTIVNRKAPSFQPTVSLDFAIGDFKLTERSGETFHAKDMLGEVWITSFFFTTCPSGCSRLNQAIADLLRGDLADLPVRFVSISVDPEIDTPEKLADYADGFFIKPKKIDPRRWLFLTHPSGSKQAIAIISKGNFHVAFSKDTHSSDYLLIDQRGRVRGKYNPVMSEDVRRMKKKIEQLLNDPPPARETM